ncbi:MAG: hypothetical protein KJ007_10210 [Burkholderiales bacterium]|nr:hypothetical protein [Burkholderiales bacterium]
MEGALHEAEFCRKNEAVGFAQRMRRNLEVIEAAYHDREDGHFVTQLINSLLDLVVMPKERKLFDRMQELRLLQPKALRWPQSNIEAGRSETSQDLVKMRQNAALCVRPIRERVYYATALVMASRETGPDGDHREPSEGLAMFALVSALDAHVGAYLRPKER